MSQDFAGQVVVVTGGTGALGSAVVARLVERGASCIVPAVSQGDVERFSLASHARVKCEAGVDLRDEQQVRAFFERARREAGRERRLWASLHLAGGFDMGPIAKTELRAWREMMDLNATTCFLCCREAVVAMREGGRGGRIVNVAARPALHPGQGARMAAYTASKAAVVALTGALASEVLEEGILVNAVAPSIMDTPANRAAMPGADHATWPKVEEVAEAIAWLASSANALTSGTVVPVYGRG